MYSFWSHCRKYQSFGQFILFGLALSVSNAQARKPASYVPDDDAIVAPVDNEISIYQKYVASDKSSDVEGSRNQIKVWNDNQQFADQYGMDSTLTGSAFFVPTADEKFEYFKDKYMRYLRRRTEQPLKDAPKNWYQEYRASNEVDTIDEMESRFKKTTKTSNSGQALPGSLQAKEVSIWKKTKFIFQPRVDQGLVIVGIKSPIAYARAWVGINGETEVNVQRSIDSTGTRLMFNYFAHSGRYFTSLDQRLMENVYARVTSNRDPQLEKSGVVQDETMMLMYAKSF